MYRIDLRRPDGLRPFLYSRSPTEPILAPRSAPRFRKCPSESASYPAVRAVHPIAYLVSPCLRENIVYLRWSLVLAMPDRIEPGARLTA